jgi:hypothetical protein
MVVKLAYHCSMREPLKFRYTIILSLGWLGLEIALWCLDWKGGKGGLTALIAGFVGYWLPLAMHVRESQLLLAVAECAGGIPVMLTLGFVQDCLRVRLVWLWVYLIGFLFAAIAGLVGLPFNLVSLLYWGCIGLYIAAVLLILGGLGVLLWRCTQRKAVV